MLEKVKAAIKKMKPTKKKAEPKFNNMQDMQNAVGSNTKKEVKSETKSETKSSLTFGN
jgi:hypothetical protein